MDGLTMKKILVLGSGPNATVPDVDIVYTANAAIGYYKDEIKRIEKKVSLVSSFALHPALRIPGAEMAQQHQNQFALIKSAPCDIHISVHDDKYPEGIASLKMAGFPAPVKSLSFKACRVILKEIADLEEPLISLNHYRARPTPSGFLSISKQFIFQRQSLLRGARSVSPFFRNSTGMIALLYAISKHGSEAEYLVSGINLRRRDLYPNGEHTSESNKKNWRFTQHVLSDLQVYRKIKMKYNIALI